MLTSRQDYVNALQKKEITIEANNLYYLKFFVNDRWAIAPHFGCVSKYFSSFNIPSLNDENYCNDFSLMYFYLGYLSCIPREVKLPQDTASKEKVFHFHPLLSPISKNCPFYDSNEVNRVKNEFFFQPENLSARHIIQNPVGLQKKLLLMIKYLLGNATSEKNKKALEIAKIKFETGKTHMEIYDKIHPKNEYKKQNVKDRHISGKLSIAKKLLKNVWPTFPNSKAEWESYFENPVQYLNQDEVFKKSPIK